MDELKFAKELRALQSLADLMDMARQVRENFDDAGMLLPEPLNRLLGLANVEEASKSRGRPTISFNIPTPDKRPPETQQDWIWVPVNELTPTIILLAILRSHSDFISSKSAVEAVSAIKKGLNPGTLFNCAARLSGTLIDKTEDGWRLKEGAIAPIICGDYAWGPEAAFGKGELAAHRRLLVKHLLTANDAGLQIVQIVSQLANSGLCRAPVTKELIKADLENLQKEGKARRRGNSKKWELCEPPESKK